MFNDANFENKSISPINHITNIYTDITGFRRTAQSICKTCTQFCNSGYTLRVFIVYLCDVTKVCLIG